MLYSLFMFQINHVFCLHLISYFIWFDMIRLRDSMRVCMTWWGVAWLHEGLRDLMRGCVTRWVLAWLDEVAWLDEGLRDSMRGYMTFWDVAWYKERLCDLERDCVTWREIKWLLERFLGFLERLINWRLQGFGYLCLSWDFWLGFNQTVSKFEVP